MSFVSNGRYCWTDLFTTNFEGAQNFYSKAFGWNIEKSPEMPNYAFAKDGDQMICGFSIADAGEASKHGLRDTFWGTYFYADNFDGTFERAKELGATVVFPKTPVANFGHFASFKDPSGSFFQIWNSADAGFKEEYTKKEQGYFCWNELYSSNLDQSGKFYCDLFSYTPENQDMGEFNYTIFKKGDDMFGGLLDVNIACGQFPAEWLNYVYVNDLGKTGEAVNAAGGKMLVDQKEIPNRGFFSVYSDPFGAHIAAFKAL